MTTVEDFYRARYLYQLSQGRGGGFKRRYCKAKFDRACMHAGAFDVLGKNLVNSHPYRLTGQVESDDWYRLRWKLQDPLPPLEQFASSSVTCSTTSASLDYIVWQLIDVNGATLVTASRVRHTIKLPEDHPGVRGEHHFTGGVIEDGAEHFRARVTPPVDFSVIVDKDPTFRISFRDGLGHDWRNRELIEWVRTAIAVFEPAFPA